MGKKKDERSKLKKKRVSERMAKASKEPKKPKQHKLASEKDESRVGKKAKKSKSEKKAKKAKKAAKDSKGASADGLKMEFCPCCKKHCPLTKPKCSKGRRIAKRLGI